MTLYTDLLAAGLPVVWASETQATFSRTLTNTEEEIYYDLLDPTRQARKQDYANAREQVKAEYQSALDTLQQIENAGTIPFTQAGFNQVVQAVKAIARIDRLMLRLLRYLIFG